MLILPVICDARRGWAFSDYSILAGPQSRFASQSTWGYDFQYDRFNSTCIRRRNYFGIGVNFALNDHYSEIGLKGMYNPTHYVVQISRNSNLYPYFFLQGNYAKTTVNVQQATEPLTVNGFLYRPGIGISGNFLENRLMSMRTYLQFGMNTQIGTSQNFQSIWVLEFKLGIGFNAKRKSADEKSLKTPG
jgi:hypothetical protein